MTIQIALFCRHSIVIAGDTQCTEMGTSLRTSTCRTKFIQDSESGLLIATSGDDALSISAAREATRWGGSAEGELELDKKYNACFKSRFGVEHLSSNPIKAELLIFHPKTQKIVHARIRIQSDSTEYSDGKLYAGDPQNAAKFFVERFYDSEMSTEYAKRLLAIAIYQASKLNTAFISGLEMFVFDRKSGKVERQLDTADLLVVARRVDADILTAITNGVLQ